MLHVCYIIDVDFGYDLNKIEKISLKEALDYNLLKDDNNSYSDKVLRGFSSHTSNWCFYEDLVYVLVGILDDETNIFDVCDLKNLNELSDKNINGIKFDGDEVISIEVTKKFDYSLTDVEKERLNNVFFKSRLKLIISGVAEPDEAMFNLVDIINGSIHLTNLAKTNDLSNYSNTKYVFRNICTGEDITVSHKELIYLAYHTNFLLYLYDCCVSCYSDTDLDIMFADLNLPFG